jgi:hypothetical protein
MYFHTDNPNEIQRFAEAVTYADTNGVRLRLDVDGQGRLRYKVGGGGWSAPIASTPDPWRDNQ